jgi:sialate O-acetylesterase
MKHLKKLMILVHLMIGTMPLQAEVRLPDVIGSHMVLQRELAVPIWGTAAPGEEVTVEFAGQTKSVKAGADNKWQVKLDPMPASAESRTMTIRGKNALTLTDVLVGEVWLGSGQSNMDWRTCDFEKDDAVLAEQAAKKYPLLRLKMNQPQGWDVAEGKNIQLYSALLFSFAVRLQKELGVPVGLMESGYGGTPSSVWLSKEAFTEDAACKEVVAKALLAYPAAEMQKRYEQQLAEWEKATAAAKEKGEKNLPGKPNPPLKPGELHADFGVYYQGGIRPLMPFGIRGVFWDQGESGTGMEGVDQFTLMGALIRSWRKEWGQGEFPFLYVQKPSGEGCAFDMSDPVTKHANAFTGLPAEVPNDGQYRETYLRIREYPNTAMVTSSDLGGGQHPVNKSGYGARAARVASGFVYGQKVEIYGPVYKSHRVEGDKMRITYTHVGQGLVFRGGEKLQGFAIAGEDGKFVWADAAIDGASVMLSNAKVANPVSVRYAWSERQPWANLFNEDGLPALPFRTDADTKR